MKTIATLILDSTLTAGSVSAEKIEDVKVPMTPELVQSINRFVMTNVAVCQKRNIEEQACSKIIEDKVKDIRAKANKVCKDYPKEVTPCLAY